MCLLGWKLDFCPLFWVVWKGLSCYDESKISKTSILLCQITTHFHFSARTFSLSICGNPGHLGLFQLGLWSLLRLPEYLRKFWMILRGFSLNEVAYQLLLNSHEIHQLTERSSLLGKYPKASEQKRNLKSHTLHPCYLWIRDSHRRLNYQ